MKQNYFINTLRKAVKDYQENIKTTNLEFMKLGLGLN